VKRWFRDGVLPRSSEAAYYGGEYLSLLIGLLARLLRRGELGVMAKLPALVLEWPASLGGPFVTDMF
jgi:hypothetical protein